MGLIDFNCMGKKYYGSKCGPVNCLITNILQNIIFCVQEKKEIHTGLQQL